MPSTTASTQAGIKLADLDYVVFYEKPFLKFERLLETYLAFAPRGFRRSAWRCRCGCGRSCSRRRCCATNSRQSDPDFDWQKRLLFSEHHQSHAAERVLSLALRGGRGADHGRRRRMGDDVGRARARATSWRS